MSNSTFQKYELGADSSLQASIFSELQKQHLHNERSTIAEEILNLTIDLEHPGIYALAKAEKQGQIGMITHLLEASALAEETLRLETRLAQVGDDGEYIVTSGVPQDEAFSPTPSVDFSKF